jgi:hypothetical protein
MIAHLRDRPIPSPTLLSDTPWSTTILPGDEAHVEFAEPAPGPSKADR